MDLTSGAKAYKDKSYPVDFSSFKSDTFPIYTSFWLLSNAFE